MDVRHQERDSVKNAYTHLLQQRLDDRILLSNLREKILALAVVGWVHMCNFRFGFRFRFEIEFRFESVR